MVVGEEVHQGGAMVGTVGERNQAMEAFWSETFR